ncbi:hypothetical protein SCLCIDRAFT_1206945 [Scleroderma citrinum Foug A]|uniref:Uncharacterized protein n=1 Tax=Scleroderma citrinum Foug A TaxID=1036808 RepID=A0A0C3B0K8_9AGAM|nr:hypothetical protein SCLCIDRAFT_1206945 [Scleroderma citrinum Foug A]
MSLVLRTAPRSFVNFGIRRTLTGEDAGPVVSSEIRENCWSRRILHATDMTKVGGHID